MATKALLIKKECRVRQDKTVYTGNLYYHGGVAILSEVDTNSCGIDDKFWEYDISVKELAEIPTISPSVFNYVLKGIYKVQKTFLDEIHGVSLEAEEFIRKGWN